MATSEWIEEIEVFRRIAPLWDEALDASGEANPFLLSDFLLTWWKHNASGKALRIYCRRSEERIVAGLPLCLQTMRWGRLLSHMGDYAANVTHFLSAPDPSSFAGPFLEALAARRDWDFCRLERVLSGSSTWAGLSVNCRLSGSPLRLMVQEAGFNARVTMGNGYEAVIRRLSPRLRRYLKRCIGEAEKLGPLRLVPAEGIDAVASLFEDYRRLSSESFRRRGRVSGIERPESASFLGELVTNFESKGRLTGRRLMAGDRLLAVGIGYRYGPGFKWILTAFDYAHAKLQPGHLLTDALLREADHGSDPFVDMYYGDSLFKNMWCDQLIPLHRITLYRNTVRNRALIPLLKFRGWAYRRMHPLPPAGAAAKAGREAEEEPFVGRREFSRAAGGR